MLGRDHGGAHGQIAKHFIVLGALVLSPLPGCEGHLDQDYSDPVDAGARDVRGEPETAQEAQPDTPTCSPGLTDCGFGSSALCVDLQTAWDHCGSCTTVCDAGQTCAAGTCVCAPGLTDCEGDCVDLETNGKHCGGCGSKCSPGVCDHGTCDCPCEPEYTDCSTSSGGCVCVDTSVNPTHCGECFHWCEWGQPCLDGVCRCPDDQVVCKGGCTDILSNPEACGACANECAEGSTCLDGACTCPCWAEQACCNDRCVPLDDDPANCGACGHACAGDEICYYGACTTATTCCALTQNLNHELGTGIQSTWIAWELAPECYLQAQSITLALPYGSAAILADDGNVPGAVLAVAQLDLAGADGWTTGVLSPPVSLILGHRYWLASNSYTASMTDDGFEYDYYSSTSLHGPWSGPKGPRPFTSRVNGVCP
jgi:Stigma-specific protein, Stig1